MKVDVSKNRKAVKYTFKELSLRVLWGGGKLVFRISPRPFFGFRRWLLRCFGAKVGQHTNIYPSALIYYPWNFSIGDDSSIGEWALVYNLGVITIGNRSTVSQRAHLCAGTHDYEDAAMPLIKPKITIGDDAWICADSFVGPGIAISDRAIVGARSVVVRDVNQSEVVAGNPSKVIKIREGTFFAE
jgi:putative colanic acid biosynthesis acetyltransferase WcaF